jgi:predicted phosphodiesterase
MRVVFLADTHNYEVANVPDGDLVVHCGDATDTGTLPEINAFLEWYATLPHKHKILVAGNHDWLFERQPLLAKQMCWERDITYLEDQGRRIEGLQIYGTPWVPVFCDWAFNLDEMDREDKFQHIPGGLDLLITHGPPHGIRDETTYDFKLRNIGCRMLRERVDRARPRVHAFGHCHAGYGQQQIGPTNFINAAIRNRNFMPLNPPTVIDLEPR